jgi:hypothetical protein
MYKMPCKKYVSGTERRKRKKNQTSASKLQKMSSLLSAMDKNKSDVNLVSGTSASKSVAVDTGVGETETELISDGINVDVDIGVRFEPEPSSTKAVNVSTCLNSDSHISWGKY